MTQHTPGPWQSFGSHPSEGFDCFWIKAQPNSAMRGFTREIATVNGSQNDKEQTANANLIAAAPELLEALQGAIDILGIAESNASGNPQWDYVGPRVAACRAAIAKAVQS